MSPIRAPEPSQCLGWVGGGGEERGVCGEEGREGITMASHRIKWVGGGGGGRRRGICGAGCVIQWGIIRWGGRHSVGGCLACQHIQTGRAPHAAQPARPPSRAAPHLEHIRYGFGSHGRGMCTARPQPTGGSLQVGHTRACRAVPLVRRAAGGCCPQGAPVRLSNRTPNDPLGP